MKTNVTKIGNTYPNLESQRCYLIEARERLTTNIIKEITTLRSESGHDGVALLIDAMHSHIINEIDVYKDCNSTPSIKQLYDLAGDVYALGNIAKRLSSMLHSFDYLNKNSRELEFTNAGILL